MKTLDSQGGGPEAAQASQGQPEPAHQHKISGVVIENPDHPNRGERDWYCRGDKIARLEAPKDGTSCTGRRRRGGGGGREKEEEEGEEEDKEEEEEEEEERGSE